MGRVNRIVVGAVAGGMSLAAAGATAAVFAEKRLIARIWGQDDPEAGEDFGGLRGAPRTVVSDDGVPLHVEVDEGAPVEDGAALASGVLDAPRQRVTTIFCHGYTLDQDCWHYQRRDLTGIGRRVFWDQRAHGRSRRGLRADTTIDQLGQDLFRVIEATVPPEDGIVLVGHSMGGMTILALADSHPELFEQRVKGVALLSTSGRLNQVTLGLPALLGQAVGVSTDPFMRTLALRPSLVDQGRQIGSELSFLSSRMLGFGVGDVPASVIRHLDSMIRRTPTDVVTEFWPALIAHDKLEALRVLENVPTLVVCGDRDRMTPIEHSEHIAEALPDAEFLRVLGAGHAVMLERPGAVNDALRSLLDRAGATSETDPVSA